MNEIKLVIFDVDGTMLNTSKGLIESARYMIERLQLNMPSEEILNTFAGPRIQDSIKRIYGLEGYKLDEAAKIFRDHYKKENIFKAEPYDGLVELLKKLKKHNKKIMIATNKRQDLVDMLADKFEFTGYFDAVYGTDMEGKLKKPDLIELCLKKYGDIERKQAAMIGDSSYDVEAAFETGVDFFGVTYGFGFKQRSEIKKWNNYIFVDSLKELEKYLLK